MKKAAFMLLAVSLLHVPSASAVEPVVQVTTIQLPDMTTVEKADEVEKSLGTLPGVSAVKASSEIESVVIVFDPVKTSAEQFIESLKDSGYTATFAKANYRCPKCTATYAKDGNCIVDDTKLEPIAQG